MFTHFLFTERDTVYVVGVIALNIINITLIPLLFMVSRRLDRRHLGWIAAGFAAFNLLLVQFGHQPRPHVPLASLSALAVAALVYVGLGANWRWMLAAAVLSALTVGTLQSGVLIVLPFALAWIARLYNPETKHMDWHRLFGAGSIAGVLLFAGLSIALYPTLIGEIIGLARNALNDGQFHLGGSVHSFSTQMFGLNNIPAFAGRLFNYQPGLTLLLPIALAWFVWKYRARVRLLIVGLSFPLVNLIIWSLYSSSFPRITAIVVPFLILMAATLLEDVILMVARRINIRAARLYLPVVLALLAFPAANALRLTAVTSQIDTRSLASNDIAATLPAGAAILTNFAAMELTPTAESLREQGQVYPESIGTQAEWLLSLAPEAYPAPAYRMINGYLLGLDDLDLRALIADNDIDYALIVTPSARVDEQPAHVRALLEMARVLQVTCPGIGIDYTYLPDDITVPAWQAIAAVERAGPIVLTFDLRQPPMTDAYSATDLFCQDVTTTSS